MKKEKYMIMLGKFSKNTPEFARKRKEAAGIDATIINGPVYLEVIAGPFTKAEADENLAKLASENIQGYIYPIKAKEEPTEETEGNAEG